MAGDESLEMLVGYGPKMSALTEQQRAYVLAMLSDPLGNPTKWARAAGYSDKSEAAKVSAFRLVHSERVQEAAQEESLRHMHTIGPALAVGVMFRIARTNGHKDQLRAAEAIANRVGLHELSEHKVTVERTDRTGAAMVERIRALAEVLGVSADALLGVNAVPAPMKVIEHVEDGGPRSSNSAAGAAADARRLDPAFSPKGRN
jgi:hypothetical protein